MKQVRIAYLVLGAALCLLLVACGKDNAPSSEPLVGAYTEERDVTSEDTAILEKALKNTDDGVTYEPLKVATQVVAGTNYRFYAKATSSTEEYYVHIVVYVPLGDNPTPELTSIERV